MFGLQTIQYLEVKGGWRGDEKKDLMEVEVAELKGEEWTEEKRGKSSFLEEKNRN